MAVVADLRGVHVRDIMSTDCATGFGKPVIYTGEGSKFEDASHLDTNHHLHVLWDAADLEPAIKKLKATIRATIPEATRE